MRSTRHAADSDIWFDVALTMGERRERHGVADEVR
jgi:hypothetical protein